LNQLFNEIAGQFSDSTRDPFDRTGVVPASVIGGIRRRRSRMAHLRPDDYRLGPRRASVMTMSRLCNLAAYQLAWLACVLGAAQGMAWAGTAFALVVSAGHLALHRNVAEVRLIGYAAAIGFVADSVLVQTHYVQFESAASSGWAPLWMVSLWMAFATTLNHSLRWLMSRAWIAALAGVIGGPLAYLAGAELGALMIATPVPGLMLVGALWGVAMWLLFLISGADRGATKGRLLA
jgi:hypothetical protein